MDAKSLCVAVPSSRFRHTGGAVGNGSALDSLRERDTFCEVSFRRSSCAIVHSFERRRHVIANDLSPAAVEAMRRNVELNDLHEKEEAPAEGTEKPKVRPAKVKVNEGDAWSVLGSQIELDSNY